MSDQKMKETLIISGMGLLLLLFLGYFFDSILDNQRYQRQQLVEMAKYYKSIEGLRSDRDLILHKVNRLEDRIQLIEVTLAK